MKPAPKDRLGDPASLTAGLWNIPNLLTMLRCVLVPVFAWLLFREHGEDTASRAWAAAVFVIASVTDWMDGYLARKWDIVTTFGKVADPIADKALTGVALLGLSILGELPWWATIVILVREIGITLMRFWVIRIGVIPASRGGKLKTIFQMLAITMYLMPVGDAWDTAKFVVLVIAVILTVVTGLDYIARVMALRKQASAADSAA